MNSVPSIVIVSCSNTKPKSLIKLIAKATEIKYDEENPAITKHPWLLDTKYYTAKVNLLGLDDDFQRNEDFNKNVEALIIHMDTNKVSGLDDLSKWDSLDNECEVEIKLLVSNYCTDDTKITRTQALEWCLKRDFEFIELYPTVNKIDQEDDDFKEKVGVERIIEALEAHTWPNLHMKNKKKMNKTLIKEKTNSDLSNNSRNCESKDEEDEVFSRDIVDDFTELFSQLHMMKDSLQSMPMSQRKQCAEQMVTAFWKAIGGEEEEIIDL